MDFYVRFKPSQKSIRVPDSTSLLEAARRVGLPVASSCGADGVCGRCGLEILESREPIESESEREGEIKQRNRVDLHLRLACRIQVDTDLTVTAPNW
jgi:uncharacterized 2Fe-2S/4Fe-4S cluster protein (DUF4445 family)